MSDFTPPSNPEPGSGDEHAGYPSYPDWSQSPQGVPPQPSPWGDPGDPSPHDPHGQPQYGSPAGQGHDPYGQPPFDQPPYGQPPYGQPHQGSAPQYGQQPYGQQPYGPGGHGWPQYGVSPYPKSSQATTALVLSIVGLLCCGPLSIVGMLMGRSEVNAIRRGEVDPAQQGTAQAGFVVGIIGTVIWAGFIVLYIGAVALSVAASP